MKRKARREVVRQGYSAGKARRPYLYTCTGSYLEEEDNAAAASVSSILVLKLFSRCLPVISRH